MKKLRYAIPSGITAAALACGVMAIVLGMRGEPVEGSWWVLTATILDRMDGLAARALKASSAFGMWLDSASDFVAFGVAPAFLFMGTSSSHTEALVLVPMVIYIVGAGTRLLRFSLQEPQKQFSGVPSTLSGGVYAVGLNVALSHGLAGETHLWLFASMLVLFGIAMNTPFLRYDKVGGVSWRWLNWLGIALVVVCSLLILFRTLPEFVFATSGLIMLIGPLISRISRNA